MRFSYGCVLVVVLLVRHFGCDEHSHEYKASEQVVLWMNTIGSYFNQQDTYGFFEFPFCRGPVTELEHYHETLAESLLGVDLEFSGLDIKFKVNATKAVFCQERMDQAKLQKMQDAIDKSYRYHMLLDDLPFWGSVGEKFNDNYYVFKHKKLVIGYNGNRIVDVNFTNSDHELLTDNNAIDYSYEVHWVPSRTSFGSRFDKYLDSKFYQHKIHWFSIFNSFMMVIFLVGLVSMILVRTLRKDYARYCRDDEDMEHTLDDYGWKQVHGDVFRSPNYNMLYSSFIGMGYHIIVVTFFVIVFAIIGDLYLERGSLLTTIIFVYAGMSSLNGFFGASTYSRNGGRRWIPQMLLSTFFIPVLVCGTSFLINFVAIYYHNSRTIPFKSMLAIVAICVFILLPLNLIGAVLGRNLCGQADFPCRTNAVPRPIPEKRWFNEPLIIASLGGILPFASIFIEMYFIFTSFWAYKIYYVYGFMLLVFLILIVVTVCVSIVSTYFLLNSEDYRWHWTSFMTGASTATYVFLYSIYYFYMKTKMFGVFQTMFYFGNMALFSIILGIMCGTAGSVGTSFFVHKIYSTVKID